MNTLWESDNKRWSIHQNAAGQVVVALDGHVRWMPRFKTPIGKKKRTSFGINWGRDDIYPPVPYVEKAVREKLSWVEGLQQHGSE